MFLDDEITNLQKVFNDTKEHLANLDNSCGSANQGVGLLIDKAEDLQRQVDSNDEDIESLQTRSTQMEETIKTISTTGGASKADAVTYDNGNSGLTALNAQSAIDELAAKDKSQDEVIGTKVDKEEGKSLISALVAGQLSVVEHEGYLLAFTDTKNNFLGGINKSGKWEIPSGIPAESEKLLVSLQAQIDDIVTKRDNVYTIGETDGYLLAILDQDKHCLGGIANSGRWVIPDGISDEAQRHIDAIYRALRETNDTLGNEITDRTSIIRTDNASYAWAIADKNNRVWIAGTLDGNVVQPHGMPDEVKAALAAANARIDNADEHVAHIEGILQEREAGNVVVGMMDAKGKELMSVNKDGDFNIIDKLKAQSGYSIKAIETGADCLYALLDANGNVVTKIDTDGKFNIQSSLNSEDGYSLETIDTMADSLYAVLDSNRNVVLNITKEGKIQSVSGITFGDVNTGISLVDSQKWLFAIVDANKEVLGGIDKNGAMFANSIEGVCNIKQVENDEWLLAFLDANEHISFGIKKDGNFYANSVQIDGIPSQEESMTFLYVITDKNNKVLWGIMKSGAVYQPYGVPEEVRDIAKQLNDRISTLDEYLTVHGVQTKVDFSDSSYIQIPEPRCAVINVTGIGSMPTSKTQNKQGWLEFWDMQGNYFKKRIIANAQGNSSMGFIKKNAAFDFCDDEWIGDETPSIRFGKWVPQDSFHMKAYYTDFFRGVGAVSYKLYNQIVETRGNRKDRPWKKELIDFSKIKATTNSFANPLQDDFLLEFDTGARCFPDGFPVICYLEGVFYGVFSWQLKKHRDNFHLDKKTAEHIHIDGNLYAGNIWQGSVAWNQFEIRNPKDLYCINTEDVSGWGYTSLDATADAEEIAAIGDNYKEVEDKPSDFTNDEIVSKYGNNPPAYLYRTSKGKWYKLVTLDGKRYLPYDGDAPVELIDDTMPYYDASNKDHVRSNQVKTYLKNLSTAVSKIAAAETVYKASSQTAEDLATFKSVIETYCDVENQIDYMILSDLIKNSDGFGKNWQWFTYNGVKWYVGLYDCDMSFGGHFQGNQITIPLTAHISTTKSNFHGYIIAYYAAELNARYKELADMGIITVDNIFSIFKDWTERVGVSNYKNEYKKWADSPCYGQSVVKTAYWELLYNEDGSPKMASSSTYNASTAYAVDDEVSYGLNSTMGYYCFKCIQAATGIAPISSFRHTDNIYRVQKWIETEVANMDKVYGYTRS